MKSCSRWMRTMTWTQLTCGPGGRHKSGSEKLQEKEPPAPLEGRNAIGFKYYDMRSVVGVRVGKIFYVVWLDTDPGLYGHGRSGRRG